jgi:hypothetical protein
MIEKRIEQSAYYKGHEIPDHKFRIPSKFQFSISNDKADCFLNLGGWYFVIRYAPCALPFATLLMERRTS